MQNSSHTKMLVLTGLSIALIAGGAFITIPFGPVPFTLQTMMIGLVLCLLPPKYAVCAMGGYLLLGALGLPIFSGFRGGFGVLAGPTGGFLIGFFVAMAAVALVRSRVALPKHTTKQHDQRMSPWCSTLFDGACLLLFSVISYTCGLWWFAVSTGTTFEAAVAACLLPFVIPDIVKAGVALVCARSVRAALGGSFVSAHEKDV